MQQKDKRKCLSIYLSIYLSVCLSVSLSVCLFVCLSVYVSRALCWTLAEFFSFLIFTQSVGLLGRGISPSQGRYLHIGQHRINADIHAWSGIRTHNPSVWASEDSSCFRQRGHCDRLVTLYRGPKPEPKNFWKQGVVCWAVIILYNSYDWLLSDLRHITEAAEISNMSLLDYALSSLVQFIRSNCWNKYLSDLRWRNEYCVWVCVTGLTWIPWRELMNSFACHTNLCSFIWMRRLFPAQPSRDADRKQRFITSPTGRTEID
jgi:hypothetical protein